MVCSITRGPANPMSAFGSAMMTSPSIAKLAVTPPVVGSVHRNERQVCFVECGECGGDLGHLHLTKACLPACARHRGEKIILAVLPHGALDQPCDLLADADPSTADERHVHCARDHRMIADSATRVDDRFRRPRRLLPESIFPSRFAIDEFERID